MIPNIQKRRKTAMLASMNRRDWLRCMAAGTTGLLSAKRLPAQSNLTLQPLRDGFHVLMGAGGNITILNTKDGLLTVDAGVPETAAAVLGKVKSVAGVPVKVLINTHWHSDHTGGNPAFGRTGAQIVAHVNTLKRVSATQHMLFFQRDVPPLPEQGLPGKTFTEQEKIAFGSHTIHVAYHPPAHTDGDSMVHFEQANILSTGDLLFSGMYPFIDYSSGGSIEGMIRNSATILQMVDDHTQIVPGHGQVSTKVQVADFHNMLVGVNETIDAHVKQGKSVDEVVAAAPTKEYDSRFGNGFLKPEQFVKMLYQGKKQIA